MNVGGSSCAILAEPFCLVRPDTLCCAGGGAIVIGLCCLARPDTLCLAGGGTLCCVRRDNSGVIAVFVVRGDTL